MTIYFTLTPATTNIGGKKDQEVELRDQIQLFIK